jgi:hypothetical protein
VDGVRLDTATDWHTRRHRLLDPPSVPPMVELRAAWMIRRCAMAGRMGRPGCLGARHCFTFGSRTDDRERRQTEITGS